MDKDPGATETVDSPSYEEVFHAVWASKKKILLLSLLTAAIALGLSFLLPDYYRSTATLLPETERSKLSGLGQFADIASLAGVNVPGGEIARLYPTILTSETVLRAVILRRYKTDQFSDSVDLVKYFDYDKGTHEKDIAASIKKVRELFAPLYDNKTSVVTLSLEMREPQLAADVLNALIDELDKFMRSKRVTTASEQVRWIDARITQVQQELRRDEDALKDFRERNRRIVDSPQLLLVQQRLMRNVEVNSAVYVELKRQFELAKLEEIKNITIVNVLDEGRPPVKRESPKHATNAAVMFLLTFVWMSGFIATKALYGTHVRERWEKVRGSRAEGR